MSEAGVKHVSPDALARIQAAFHEFDFSGHAILAAHMGSVSHGTYIPPVDPNAIDDVDLMAVVVPPRRLVYGIHRFEHWVWKQAELDVTVYALDKFVRLLLKSNPNVVGLLWLRPEEYILKTPEAERFIAARGTFSSRRAYDAFVGYAQAQIHKMESLAFRGYMGEKRKRLVERCGYDCKNAAHAVRLYRMGIEFLETGQLHVYRAHDREELMAIKRGDWTLEQVKRHVASLEQRAAAALENAVLPEQPDATLAERLLLWSYEQVWARTV